jgi:hypothetical protein
VDQVRSSICTTVQPPEVVSDTVRRLGGTVRFVSQGFVIPMPGVDVWLIQKPDGITPLPDLFYGTTYSIQDGTYSFFNVPPGEYLAYAQAWVSGWLYTASLDLSVSAEWLGEVNMENDLTLY